MDLLDAWLSLPARWDGSHMLFLSRSSLHSSDMIYFGIIQLCLLVLAAVIDISQLVIYTTLLDCATLHYTVKGPATIPHTTCPPALVTPPIAIDTPIEEPQMYLRSQ